MFSSYYQGKNLKRYHMHACPQEKESRGQRVKKVVNFDAMIIRTYTGKTKLLHHSYKHLHASWAKVRQQLKKISSL